MAPQFVKKSLAGANGATGHQIAGAILVSGTQRSLIPDIVFWHLKMNNRQRASEAVILYKVGLYKCLQTYRDIYTLDWVTRKYLIDARCVKKKEKNIEE